MNIFIRKSHFSRKSLLSIWMPISLFLLLLSGYLFFATDHKKTEIYAFQFNLDQVALKPAFVITDCYSGWLFKDWTSSKLSLQAAGRVWTYRITVPLGYKSWYTLEFPDKTFVDIGPGGSVEYPSDFLRGNRYLYVQGNVNIKTDHATQVYYWDQSYKYVTDEDQTTIIDLTSDNDSGSMCTYGGLYSVNYLIPPNQLIKGTKQNVSIGNFHFGESVTSATVHDQPFITITPILQPYEMHKNPLVTLHIAHASLIEVLTALSNQTGCAATLNRPLAEMSNSSDISLDSVPWTVALSTIFNKQKKLDFLADSNGRFIACSPKHHTGVGIIDHFDLAGLIKEDISNDSCARRLRMSSHKMADTSSAIRTTH